MEQIEQTHGGRLRTGAGFTLVELLIVMAIVSLLVAIAMAGYSRARASASEAAAVHALRTIHSAQAAFRGTCGHERDYAATLVQLGATSTISADMATGPTVIKSDYLITLTATAPGGARDTCSQGETAAHWYASAVPMAGVGKGLRGFATADDEDIWQDTSGAAPVAPFAPGDKVSRISED